jgi:hypothetical protein
VPVCLPALPQWCESIFAQFARYPPEIKELLLQEFGLDYQPGILPLSEAGAAESEARDETKGDRVLTHATLNYATTTARALTREISLADRLSRLLGRVREIADWVNDHEDRVENWDLGEEIFNFENALVLHRDLSHTDLPDSLSLLRVADSLERALLTVIRTPNGGTVGEFSESDKKELDRGLSKVSQTLRSFSQEVDQELDTQRQRKLLHYPQVFHSAIRDHLSRFQPGSRQWLFEEVNDWLIGDSVPVDAPSEPPTLSRVFWIQADAGMGKSAFAAALANKLKDESLLLGAYFCQYTSSNESASKIIRSWAAQCCENLRSVSGSSPSCAKTIFERAFIAWDKIPEDEKPSGSDLFEMLLIDPLREYTAQANPHPPGSSSSRAAPPPMVLLIDALDEVLSSDQRKPLLFVLSSKLQDLPPWVKVVVTSRPEADIVHAFSRLQPREIKEDDPRHLRDIRLFVESKLREVMDEDELASGVALFMDRSEGRFIYVSSVAEEIIGSRLSRWSLSELQDRLPEGGLVGWYRDFFVRMKARDSEYFSEVLFPAVGLIVRTKGSLTVGDVKMILRKLDLSRSEERRLIDELHQLFPLRCVDKPNSSSSSSSPSEVFVFVPFHKSVTDWLTNEDLSGSDPQGTPCDNFFISLCEEK